RWVDAPDPAAELAHVGPPERLAEDRDRSLTRVTLGPHDREHGRLAGTVWTQYDPPLSRHHSPVDGADELLPLRCAHRHGVQLHDRTNSVLHVPSFAFLSMNCGTSPAAGSLPKLTRSCHPFGYRCQRTGGSG